MEGEQSTEKKEKKGAFYSLRKSFSGRTSSKQDLDIPDSESITSGQGPSSPFSDRSITSRRASAPSSLMVVDENTSDLGSEHGVPKKSKKMFSTKFVKKMFRSGSFSGSQAGDDHIAQDNASVAEEDDALDESRMSEAGAATGTVDESGSPTKKKKRFSTKFVTKMFRSNSMSSANGGDAMSAVGGETPSVAGDSEANASPAQSRRKSMFSFGSSYSKNSPKPSGENTSGIAGRDETQVPVDPYQGPVSPTFVARRPFAEGEPQELVYSSPNAPIEQQNKLSPIAATSPAAGHNSSGTGSGWKLFEAVEASSPGRLEYDLPLQNAAESQDEVGDSYAEEPFSVMNASLDSFEEGKETNEVGGEEEVPVFELNLSDDDNSPPAAPPSSPPFHPNSDPRRLSNASSSNSKRFSAEETPYSPNVTSPQQNYAGSEAGSVSSSGKQKKSSMFSTKGITKMWRRASLSASKMPLSPSLQNSSSSDAVPTSPASLQSLAVPVTSTSPLPRAPAVKSPHGPMPQKMVSPVKTPSRSSELGVAGTPQFAVVQGTEFDAADQLEEQQLDKGVADVTSVSPLQDATSSKTSSPRSKSPLRSIVNAMRGRSKSPAPERNSKSSPQTPQLQVNDEAIAALQDMPAQAALSPEHHTEARNHDYFDANATALDGTTKPATKRGASPKKTRSPEKFIFDITQAMKTASEMLSVEDPSVPFEAPKSVFVVEGSVDPSGPGNPSVLKICVPSKSESEVASLMIPPSPQVPVTVLILRNTGIISPERFSFSVRFPYLTDLDLGFNGISGAVKGLPPSLRRLDLSHNRITNISSILTCVDLVELNLSHNNIKSFHGLPAKLERVDLSHNAITAAITLRTLALSPLIKSLDLTGNSVILDVLEWKIVLKTILTHLEDLNGRPLPKPKRAAVIPTVGKKSPSKARPAAVVREEQRVNDAVRTRMHKMKLDMLKETQELADKTQSAKNKTLKPEEMTNLSKRLLVPTKALAIKSKSDPLPPPLFSSRDLAQRRSVQPPPSVTAQYARNDINLTDWSARMKIVLTKAVQLIVRITQLSVQDVIDRDDILKLSNSLSRLELYTNRDVPLKVEYAIEKLVDGDALKRRVATVREHMDVVGQLLQQIDSAMLLSAQGAFALRDALDSSMSSGPGLVAHTAILRSYDSSFNPNSFVSVRSTSPSAGWQGDDRFQSSSMVDDDRYDFANSVKQAQDQFSYHVKDADSRHNTPARLTARSSRSPERNATQGVSAPVGYDEKKQSDTSESVMDRMRNRITNRAFNGTYSTAALTTDNAAPAEEAENSSLSKQPSHSSSGFRANAAEDDHEIPPPPTEEEPVAKSLEEKVSDRKSVAMNRVMARMSSRSASMKLDVEAPPPPPPLPPAEPVVEVEESAVTTAIDSDRADAVEQASAVEESDMENAGNYSEKEEEKEGEQEYVEEPVYSYSEESERDEEVQEEEYGLTTASHASETYEQEETSPAETNDLSPSYATESFYIPTNFYDEQGAEEKQANGHQQVHVSTSHTGIAELDAFPSNGSSDGLEVKEEREIVPETKQPVLSFREPVSSVYDIAKPDTIAAPASAPVMEPAVMPAAEPAVEILEEVPAVEETVPEKEPSPFGVPHEFLVPPPAEVVIPVVEKEAPFVALPPVEVQSETPEPRSEGSSPVPSEGAAPLSAKERIALRMAKMKEAKK